MKLEPNRLSLRRVGRVLAAAFLAGVIASPATGQQQAPPGANPDAPPAGAPPAAAEPGSPPKDAGEDRRGALIRAVVGTWIGNMDDGGQRVSLRITFGADRGYRQVSLYPNGVSLTIRATWDIALPNKIEFEVIDWSPKQYCQKPGSCQRIDIPRTFVKTFRFVDDNTIRTEDGVFRRDN